MHVFDVERARAIDMAIRRVNPTTDKTVLAVLDIPNVVEADAEEAIEGLLAGSAEECAIIADHLEAVREGEEYAHSYTSEAKCLKQLSRKFGG